MRFSPFFLLLLAGCTHTPPPQPIQHVYCVTADQYAALVKAKPAKVGHTLTGDARKDFKIVAGQDVLLENYSDGLLTVIGGCMG